MHTGQQNKLFGPKMATSERLQFHKSFKTIKKINSLQVFQFQCNCETYPIVQISSSKLPITTHACSPIEQSFGAKMATSERF